MYGGLFIHKGILNIIGFPNQDFYLYEDDHEWTYRITKCGGAIYAVLNSKIEDLDFSSMVATNPTDTIFSSISKGEPFRVYYRVRNRVYFEVNNLVNNKFVYWLNITTFLFFTSLCNTKNLKLIINAIKDGYKGKLGKVDIFNDWNCKDVSKS